MKLKESAMALVTISTLLNAPKYQGLRDSLESLNFFDSSESPISSSEISDRLNIPQDRVQRVLNAATCIGLLESIGVQTYRRIETPSIGPRNSKSLLDSILRIYSNYGLSPIPISQLETLSLPAELLKEGERLGLWRSRQTIFEFSDSLQKELATKPPEHWRNVFEYQKIFLYPFFEHSALWYSLKSGKAAWKIALQVEALNPFELYQSHPEIMKLFSFQMSQLNKQELPSLVQKIPVKVGANILELGGGSGALAREIVKKHPSLNTYTIYELPKAIESFDQREPLSSKIEFVEGDFFQETPNRELLSLENKKFDQIILSWVLHDWGDDKAVQILQRAQRHLKDDGQIVLIEALLPEEGLSRAHYLDLLMLLHTGEGRERKLSDFLALAKAAGLARVERLTSSTQGRQVVVIYK